MVAVKSTGLHLPNDKSAQISAASWAAYFALCNRLPSKVVFSGAAGSLIQRYYLFTRQYFNVGGGGGISEVANHFQSPPDSFFASPNQSVPSLASLATSTTTSTSSTSRGHFKPKKCLSLLHLLAGSVARLNLRTEVLQEDALLAILLFEMQLRDTAKQAAASSASALSGNNNVSAVDDFSAANFALHQAAVRLPLAELDHIMEDDVDDREDEEEEEDGTEQKKKKKKGEQDKSGRSVTMTAGSSGERLQQPPPKLNLSALLHVSVNICPVIANYPIQLRALQARQPPLRFHLYN